MNIKESLDIIDAGWILKPAGFRVSYEEDGPTGTVGGLVPDEGSPLLDSDVVAWRLAWKLAQVHVEEGPTRRARYRNVRVVDDQGAAIRYYVLNDYHVFNPAAEGSAGQVDSESTASAEEQRGA